MAAPDISEGTSSLIWGYINKPVALKKPRQKNSGDNTDTDVPGGIKTRMIIVNNMLIEPATMTHLRVLNTLSETVPQQGAPRIMPTVSKNMRLPVVRAEYPITSIR